MLESNIGNTRGIQLEVLLNKTSLLRYRLPPLPLPRPRYVSSPFLSLLIRPNCAIHTRLVFAFLDIPSVYRQNSRAPVFFVGSLAALAASPPLGHELLIVAARRLTRPTNIFGIKFHLAAARATGIHGLARPAIDVVALRLVPADVLFEDAFAHDEVVD
ncbi:hypothetical protein B0J13DRAFT_254361 [Dactylonectria estremocensis]|uniref:Uncharacterized protein n=1 Tax=Dactylonectria estremocensis TaxID=1079267 RepID=A0A9P9F4F1_9HYPO|nr:hypothetical protein B0J13DRAFT_254361 [Dactylonectria estremocensis]